MITLRDLKNWSDDIKPIIFDINVVANNLYILNHENSQIFKLRYPELFNHLWYQQYFIIIIQLSKIFSKSDNQKRNITKMCNRYKNEKLDPDLKQMLSNNKTKLTDVFLTHQEIKIAIDQLLIEISEKSILIDKVIFLRDNVFAHTDPDSKYEKIILEEILDLSNFATKIFNTLFGKVLDEYYHFSITKNWDFRGIIEAFK